METFIIYLFYYFSTQLIRHARESNFFLSHRYPSNLKIRLSRLTEKNSLGEDEEAGAGAMARYCGNKMNIFFGYYFFLVIII